ncbi:MAG: chemotaxis protein [Hahellaceae bacterium]|nr:chemotaxis protein [Hahellaceae bacterium]
MTDATLDARKSGSFDLVEREIAVTLEQAELSLVKFQENRESGEDLQNCIDCLNQLRGIFTLIELQGGTVLCQEIVAIANEVPVGASEDKNNLLASLSQSIFVLNRYIEYFDRRREDHPELLLNIINKLRTVRKAKPLPDSYFFDVDIPRSTPVGLGEDVPAKTFEYRVRRMRHMYQVGLLTLLRQRETDIAFRLLERAANGLHRLCATSSIAMLWRLTGMASSLMLHHQFEITHERKRLFMRIERYAGELAKLGKVSTAKPPSETVARELVYIIAISGDEGEATRQLLSEFKLTPSAFDEKKLVAHRHFLMGPGSDVLTSLSKALNEEINLIKDKLDIIERGIETPEGNGLDAIAESLIKLSDTLQMLDLKRLGELAKSVGLRVEGWARATKEPGSEDLMQIADAVLSIEQAVSQLENEGLTSETDRIASQGDADKISPYLSDALGVVLTESKTTLALSKRAITAFLESGGDKLHLASLEPSLVETEGALAMIHQVRASRILLSIKRCIHDRLIQSETRMADDALETLADALTSLEFYVESLERSKEGNAELLNLADDSVRALGYQT